MVELESASRYSSFKVSLRQFNKAIAGNYWYHATRYNYVIPTYFHGRSFIRYLDMQYIVHTCTIKKAIWRRNIA